jgi:hypothetical protein
MEQGSTESTFADAAVRPATLVRCRRAGLALLAAAVSTAPVSAGAFSVTIFPGSTYSSNTAAMDTALGITGLTIEDFEDVNLAPGLQIQFTNPNAGPISILPRLYFDGTTYTNNSWAGLGALVNTIDNYLWAVAPGSIAKIADRTTFLVPGVQKFGVGLGNFQSDIRDHALFVNGVLVHAALETVPDFATGINVRNGYLVITAGAGEVISSVGIEPRLNGTATPEYDGLIFDHVAYSPPGAALSTLTLRQSTVAGCKSASGTVTLAEPAPLGGKVVTISDTVAAATSPASVTVPAGATSKSFTIPTTPVAEDQSGTVSATLGGATLSQSLTVRRIGMQAIAFKPTSAVGGTLPAVIGTAKLECKAGPGPITVDLASSKPEVAYPVAASIVVPAGLQSAPFDVMTEQVYAKTTAPISATANGIKKTKSLTVYPAASVSPTSLKFGSVTVGTTSGTLSATLTNKGAGPFAVNGISLMGTGAAWYAQTNDCPASLAAGASCSIGVTFTPAAALSKSAKLSIATSATTTPLSVSLSGSGAVPPP